MMITYKLINDFRTGQLSCILRSDGWSIPFDQANTDYQEYQKWLSEGNMPIPADE